jgi:DNA repair exonuclease SbcCD nuclease subunit
MIQTSINHNQLKILFLADSHLGLDYPIYPRIKRRRRGDDFFKNYKSILNHAKSKKADLLIHGGDLFFRSRVHEKIIDLAYEPLLNVATAGIPVFIVPGNHERGILPNSLLRSHKHIYVFDKPRTFSLGIRGLNIALSGFPFQRGNIRRDFKTILTRTEYEKIKADVNFLCIHQAVEGAMVGPSNFTFRNGKDTIKLADIPFAFDAVLSGHIHRHQILSNISNENKKVLPIIYPGSIERTAFAEKNEVKGFVEIHCSKAGIEKVNFKRLPSRPMYDLNIYQADSINLLKASIAKTISDFDQNAIVRIKIAADLNETTKQQLNTAFFKSFFPATMNFQFTREFFKISVQETS